MSGEDSQTSPIILLDNIQQLQKSSGGRQSHLYGERVLNKEKKYQKAIIKLLVFIVIPFGIKVHLKF